MRLLVAAPWVSQCSSAQRGSRSTRNVLLHLIIAAQVACAASVTSPDGVITASVRIADGRVTYGVSRSGVAVLGDGPLGITLAGRQTAPASLGNHVSYGNHESYATRGVHGIATNWFNGALIPVHDAGTQTCWLIDMRVFNDGVAFRYMVPGSGAKTVSGEATGFSIPANGTAWFQGENCAYESPHEETTVGAIARGRVVLTPFVCRLPGDEGYAAIMESSADNYCGAGLVKDNNLLRIRLFSSVAAGGTITSAWRAVVLARDLNGLVNCDIVGNLAPPPDPALFPQGVATPWVKPGRCVWSWLGGSGVSYENMKQFNDLAQKIAATCNLVDEGWSHWSTNDQACWRMIGELAAHATSRGVDLWIWKAYPDRAGIPGVQSPARWNEFFDRCVSAGVVGVKIDFFDAENQSVIANQHALLRAAAMRKLLINFHGTPKPAGESRSYPNEVTREGVRGREYGPPNPWQTVTIPFTRMLAGHADYTPLAFSAGGGCGPTTPANQIASLIVFTSPLTCYAEHPDAILKHPCAGIITNVPTTWDETIVLPCSDIGRVAAFARRSGKDWFLGVMNGLEPTNVTINATFLGAGTWKAISTQDGANGIVACTVEASKPMTIKLQSGGGYAAWLRCGE